MHGRYFDTVFFFKDCFQLLDDMISTLTTECFQELEEEGFNRYAHPDKHLRLQVSCTYLLMPVCPLGAQAIDQGTPLFSLCAHFPIFLKVYLISFVSFAVLLSQVPRPSSSPFSWGVPCDRLSCGGFWRCVLPTAILSSLFVSCRFGIFVCLHIYITIW